MKKLIWFLLPFILCFTFQDDYFIRLSEAAIERTTHKERYDGQYRKIKYPGGDVPDSIGVCTDVIIRAYRKVGSDLQVLIHEDMKKAKAEYDKRRKTDKLDASIDHRRTQNMETFFTRQGAKLAITRKAEDYKPGDIVFFDVAYGHVGMVVNRRSADNKRFMIVHNIGRGTELEDFLFEATITGHYRWKP
ncbi:MAG: DUF1287 domain-containing protein [Cytophagaceae bacterium]